VYLNGFEDKGGREHGTRDAIERIARTL